ncbi:uncharacterized protein Dwil_GK25741 [Drosophila willistoni]|uniref:Enkurin domain-containing protein n=1 Tax=Drosophila willistoni TaxID=7260 RepID=B4NBW5_DROWI|nr:uncharacterized protein Dwil_GK25741 [Drosophila willistoni]
MFLKHCPPTLGGLFAFGGSSKRSERNFLRENVLVLRGQAHNYELPTAASLARRHGSSAEALAEVQRRLMTLPAGRKRNRDRPGMALYSSSSSEKQIQTEDTWYPNQNQVESTTRHPRSEGDESLTPLAQLVQGHGLRRSASNFELGKMTEQRGSYQPGQYDLHRPLGDVAAIVPSSKLDTNGKRMTKQNQQHRKQRSIVMDKRKKTKQPTPPRVLEVSIPEIIDAQVEPEDLPSDFSLDSKPNEDIQATAAYPSSPSPSPSQEAAPAQTEPKRQRQPQLQPQHLQNQLEELQPILLSDAERVTLIKLAQTRQSQLIAEYNRLPISMGTLRVRNLKHQLEQQLDVVEKDLSLLTQPRVYVK